MNLITDMINIIGDIIYDTPVYMIVIYFVIFAAFIAICGMAIAHSVDSSFIIGNKSIHF